MKQDIFEREIKFLKNVDQHSWQAKESFGFFNSNGQICHSFKGFTHSKLPPILKPISSIQDLELSGWLSHKKLHKFIFSKDPNAHIRLKINLEKTLCSSQDQS